MLLKEFLYGSMFRTIEYIGDRAAGDDDIVNVVIVIV